MRQARTRSGAAMAFAAVFLSTQVRLPAQNENPINDRPNPYVGAVLQLPEGRVWGQASGVYVDRDGKSVWVADRCGGNSCLKSDLDPILEFDASGKLVKSFGKGMFVAPHGIYVDQDDNVWVTDG